MSPRKTRLINEIISIGGLKSKVFQLLKDGKSLGDICLLLKHHDLSEDSNNLILYHISDYNRLVLSPDCDDAIPIGRKPEGLSKDINDPIYFFELNWSNETVGNYQLN